MPWLPDDDEDLLVDARFECVGIVACARASPLVDSPASSRAIETPGAWLRSTAGGRRLSEDEFSPNNDPNEVTCAERVECEDDSDTEWSSMSAVGEDHGTDRLFDERRTGVASSSDEKKFTPDEENPLLIV